MASDAANRHPFRLLGALSLVALSLSHLGCTALADRVATRLAEHRVEGLTQGVTVVEGELALYRDCLKNRGGSCSGGAESALPGAREASVSSPARPLAPTVTSSIETLPQGHPARTAHDALEHPFVHKVMGLYNHLRGLDGSSKTPGLEVASRESAGGRESTVRFTTSPSELQDFVDRVHTASIAGGWGALADHSAERARETATSNPKAAKDAHRDARRLAYIRNYLHAYFDDGRFVQVRLETGDLDTRVNQYLARRFPQLCGAGSLEEDCSKLVTDLRDEILRGVATTQDGTAYVFGSVGAAGFVSRSGSTAKFPGFQLSLDPYGAQEASFGIIGNVDYTVIGSDVIRVLLEAIFDAHEGLPAVTVGHRRPLHRHRLSLRPTDLRSRVGAGDPRGLQPDRAALEPGRGLDRCGIRPAASRHRDLQSEQRGDRGSAHHDDVGHGP